MFIVYDNKVYCKQGDGYVEVEIYLDKIINTGNVVKKLTFDTLYTLNEIKIKFNIKENYVEEIKELNTSDVVEEKTKRKYTRKAK